MSNTATEELRPIAPDAERHLPAMARLAADLFTHGQYVDEISDGYIGNSHYDWRVSRLIFDGETLVHHWGVWGYLMRVGPARVRAAGVGAVGTLEAYRNRGLMDRAARASLEAMRAAGYDLTILRGRHYTRYGYVRAWNYVTYRLKPDEIPAPAAVPPYRALGPESLDAIGALYNQSHADFSGTAVRPTYRRVQAADMNLYGWFDAGGQLAGYVRAAPTDDKLHLQCLEAAGDPQQGLAVLAELFKAAEYQSLAFFTLPQQHPMLQRLRRGACVVEDRYFYHTGWQVRIVNLHGTLEKLRPALEARLRLSPYAAWRGALHLEAGEESASLEIGDGHVRIATAAPGEHRLYGPGVARLLIGSDEPSEIVQQGDLTCTGEAAALAGALFPSLRPMMSQWDEY